MLRIRILSHPLLFLHLYGAPTAPLRSPFGRSSVEGRSEAVGGPKGGRRGWGGRRANTAYDAETVKFSKALGYVAIKSYFCS